MTTVRVFRIANYMECDIIGRINRFVVDVGLKGNNYRASINNTGKLEQFLVEGRKAFCVHHKKPMKTDFRFFAVEDGDHAAIMDTRIQMQAFEKTLEMQLIPWLAGFQMMRRDAQLGNSRIDYLLEHDGEQVYLEVKSAVFQDGHHAMYPDCPTARGRKHVQELTDHVRAGGQATILFLAALPYVDAFRPYRDGDPELCDMLITANEVGVEMRSIEIAFNPKDGAVHLFNGDLPVEL